MIGLVFKMSFKIASTVLGSHWIMFQGVMILTSAHYSFYPGRKQCAWINFGEHSHKGSKELEMARAEGMHVVDSRLTRIDILAIFTILILLIKCKLLN